MWSCRVLIGRFFLQLLLAGRGSRGQPNNFVLERIETQAKIEA